MKLQFPNGLNPRELGADGKRPVRFNLISLVLAMVAVYGVILLLQGAGFTSKTSGTAHPVSTNVVTEPVGQQTESPEPSPVNPAAEVTTTQPRTLFSQQYSQPGRPAPKTIVNSEAINYPKYIIRSAAFLILLTAGLWWAKKWAKSRQGANGHVTLPMEVLGKRYLGPKQSVVAMKVGEKVLLLGVTERSINLLTTLADEELDAVETTSEKNADANRNFADLVSHLTRKYQV